MTKPVSIIVPVYGDWPSLKECIESLIEHVDLSLHKAILVNDCGPEADLIEKNILQATDGNKGFQYFRNDKNLGFVGTCNRAVNELDKTNNDILLLNSDTKVTERFLDEMLGVLYASSKNGCVSPRSNNATIATVPLSAVYVKGIGAKKSYALYKRMKKNLPVSYEVPVAHGFCMLIRRPLIKKYGLFDPVFGKGYGEEVDFCMRVAKQGFKCLLANHAYVFHLEARSFSLEKKAKLLEENNTIIWERYPDYRKKVQDYMRIAIDRERILERRAGYFGVGRVARRLLRKFSH